RRARPRRDARGRAVRRLGLALPALAAASGLLESAAEALDGGQRNRDPVRPVGLLVGHLVDGLLELEGGEQHLPRLRVGGKNAALGRAGVVTVEERSTVASLPRRRQHRQGL